MLHDSFLIQHRIATILKFNATKIIHREDFSKYHVGTDVATASFIKPCKSFIHTMHSPISQSCDCFNFSTMIFAAFKGAISLPKRSTKRS